MVLPQAMSGSLANPAKSLESWRAPESGSFRPTITQECMARGQGALKIQSANNKPPVFWRRSHAVIADRRPCRAQSLYCANQPHPALYLCFRNNRPSGAIKRLRPTTRYPSRAGPRPGTNREFQFPECTDLRAGVKRANVIGCRAVARGAARSPTGSRPASPDGERAWSGIQTRRPSLREQTSGHQRSR